MALSLAVFGFLAPLTPPMCGSPCLRLPPRDLAPRVARIDMLDPVQDKKVVPARWRRKAAESTKEAVPIVEVAQAEKEIRELMSPKTEGESDVVVAAAVLAGLTALGVDFLALNGELGMFGVAVIAATAAANVDEKSNAGQAIKVVSEVASDLFNALTEPASPDANVGVTMSAKVNAASASELEGVKTGETSSSGLPAVSMGMSGAERASNAIARVALEAALQKEAGGAPAAQQPDEAVEPGITAVKAALDEQKVPIKYWQWDGKPIQCSLYALLAR